MRVKTNVHDFSCIVPLRLTQQRIQLVFENSIELVGGVTPSHELREIIDFVGIRYRNEIA